MQTTAAEGRKPSRRGRPITQFFVARLARAARLYERYRQRRHLAELDDHLLADVGLTRQDVHRECSQPFWR
ncbi:DUF1127 domain-containing protein [Chelativorans sp. AA-79]|uniref:DUF1127 domain-containing protein n=1 Tax=Chelativorans sp. AA-79 TaxID=3028735 RepID=UPI0023F9A173|nr:DUF1127 domain-containing protein [Chelativorans sp. AA-79]WEX09374.1 DUF1127 domain-containing protein [Chelativorans sp. AA-79]